jgi:dTDP-4-dehydrorhamnose 3,5-epimerase
VRFRETELAGVFVIVLEPFEDERGFFARSWSPEEFEARGLNPTIAQVNVGFNARRGTLRGLHYQRPPFEEAKLVRCTRGAIHDVAVDLRPGSTTFRRSVASELSMDNHRMMYIPEGCAHGYLTLTDDAEITYQTSQAYAPEAATGARYDDPALGIEWPIAIEVISEQDRSWALLDGPGT